MASSIAYLSVRQYFFIYFFFNLKLCCHEEKEVLELVSVAVAPTLVYFKEQIGCGKSLGKGALIPKALPNSSSAVV